MEETEPFAWLRTNMHTVAKQGRQALHDRQSEPEAAAAFTRGVVELVIFVEDQLEIMIGDADAGVPDLDPEYLPMPATSEQHLPTLGVFQGVRQQITDHLLEQARIAIDRETARYDVEDKVPGCGVITELIAQPLQQAGKREADELGMDRPGFELVDIEERTEHARHGGGRLVQADHECQGLILLFVANLPGQDPAHQTERLQRLAKIMARSGQEAGLGDVGLLRVALGGFQCVGGEFASGGVNKGDDDALNPVILGAIGQYQANIPSPIPSLNLALDRRETLQHGARIEAAIGVALLNRMFACGRPKSVRCPVSAGATK